MFKHILVPTDGSELSQKAIRNAAILARENRARLTVFHARPELRMPFYDEYIRIENDMWNECARLSGEEARRYLDDAARTHHPHDRPPPPDRGQRPACRDPLRPVSV